MIIALVEDCDITRFLHSALIKNLDLNIELQKYSSGEEFLENLKDRQLALPDLVLTDYNMAKLNGVDVINELEKFSSTHAVGNKLKSYLVSANVDLENIVKKCNKDICQGFVPKPLNSNNLVNIFKEQGYDNYLKTA